MLDKFILQTQGKIDFLRVSFKATSTSIIRSSDLTYEIKINVMYDIARLILELVRLMLLRKHLVYFVLMVQVVQDVYTIGSTCTYFSRDIEGRSMQYRCTRCTVNICNLCHDGHNGGLRRYFVGVNYR